VTRGSRQSSRAHGGHRSLRVEHESNYAPHVFSTLSQRVPVEKGAPYEAKF